MRIEKGTFQPAPPPRRFTLRRAVVYCAVILAGLLTLTFLDRGYIRPFMSPTFTPTRTSHSFLEEGRSFFSSGQLDEAILTYQQAVRIDPDNPSLWIEMARIQTYSSAVILSSEQKKQRLTEALESIQNAIDLDPENGLAFAVRALTRNWYADPNIVPDPSEREDLLTSAYQDSVRALQLSPNDPLALAYQAEVLTDLGNWAQALDVAARAVEIAPDEMDTHRVYAYVLESTGLYERAIEEYTAAIRNNPNLPFLYMRRGANYRHLGERQLFADPSLAKYYTQLALDDFAFASSLNPKDPLPYLSIANTYARQGEFFIAERNAQKALQLDPTNANIYGRLGVIYFQAKNYETSLIVLKCAVRGCPAAENEEAEIDITGLSLAGDTVGFYYTYGSVCAFYGQCGEAAAIFAELRASPWYDENIGQIIREGEVICAAIARRTPTP